MKKLVTLACVLIANYAMSQVFTNSSGNAIFYTEKAKQFTAKTSVSKNATEVSLKANNVIKATEPIKYYKSDDGGKTRTYTVETSYGWTAKIGMINAQSITKEIKNPGFSAEIGFLKGLDSINRSELRKWGYSWGTTAKLQYDNKKVLYDTQTQTTSNEYPYTVSINTHFECYIANLDALAFGITFGYVNSTNYGDLTAFQQLPIQYQDANIASIGDEAGKIGTLQRTNNLYTSLAVPIFLFKKTVPNTGEKSLYRNLVEKLAITPYIHYLYLDSNKLNPGFSVSLVNQALNSTRYEALFDSAFSLGIDWIRNNGEWSSPIYYIGGAISIDGIIDSLTEEEEKE